MITTFKLISPPRSRYSKPLSKEDLKLYSTRWAIETVFQKLKDRYGLFKLSPSFKYDLSRIHAEIYYTLTKYNFYKQSN